MMLKPDQASRLAADLLTHDSGPPEELPGPELVLGTCRIKRLIGCGGMAQVFEAQQGDPPRRVALKIVRRDLLSASLLKRFAYEARVLSRLEHPGIARLYECGRAETPGGITPFFAMEFVDGEPITQHAKMHALDTAGRLTLFLQAC